MIAAAVVTFNYGFAGPGTAANPGPRPVIRRNLYLFESLDAARRTFDGAGRCPLIGLVLPSGLQESRGDLRVARRWQRSPGARGADPWLSAGYWERTSWQTRDDARWATVERNEWREDILAEPIRLTHRRLRRPGIDLDAARKLAWLGVCAFGLKLREVAQVLGTSIERTRQVVAREERRMEHSVRRRACRGAGRRVEIDTADNPWTCPIPPDWEARDETTP